MTARVAWWFMFILAAGVGLYAASLLLTPAVQSPLIEGMLAFSTAGALTHFFAGSVVIVAGALQLSRWLRSRNLVLHRWLGRIYVIGVCLGGVAGLVMAFNSTGGLVTHIGFGLLAITWVGTTVKAWLCIRAGNVQAHRAWMLRSYALTLAAVTLRLYLPISAMLGIPFEEAYTAIAWLCWVPNLLVVEWFLLPKMPYMAELSAE